VGTDRARARGEGVPAYGCLPVILAAGRNCAVSLETTTRAFSVGKKNLIADSQRATYGFDDFFDLMCARRPKKKNSKDRVDNEDREPRFSKNNGRGIGALIGHITEEGAINAAWLKEAPKSGACDNLLRHAPRPPP